jgi:hypothetical protein
VWLKEPLCVELKHIVCGIDQGQHTKVMGRQRRGRKGLLMAIRLSFIFYRLSFVVCRLSFIVARVGKTFRRGSPLAGFEQTSKKVSTVIFVSKQKLQSQEFRVDSRIFPPSHSFNL